MIARNALFIAILAGSFALLVLGITNTAVSRNVWTQVLAGQAGIMALSCFALAGVAVFLIRAGKPALLLGLLLSLAFALGFAFGPEGFLGGLLVVSCCLITGYAILLPTGGVTLPAIDIFATGFSAMILLLTGASIAQVDMPTLFWLIPAACGGALILPAMRQRLIADFSAMRRRPKPIRYPWSSIVTLGLIGLGLSFFAAEAAMPDAAWDALVMHLLIPTQILMHGHWDFDPVLYAFAFFPLGADYLYAFAMNFGGEMGAKFLNLLILFAIVLQLYGLSARLFGGVLARYAVLLFLAIPIALVVTASLFVENTLALLTLTAVRLLIAQEKRADRAVLLALILLAGAMPAVKLHGLFIATPVAAIALTQRRTGLSPADWRWAGIVAALCALLGLLPYLFAWLKTGNPVFMFKNAIFHSPYWSPTNMVDTRWIGKLSPRLLYDMTFRSDRYSESLPGAMGFAFITLLPAGLAACCIRPRRALTITATVALTYLALVLLQMQYTRYLYPVFSLLILLCMAAFDRLRHYAVPRPVLATVTVMLALLGFYKWPSGAWAQQTANFAAIYDIDQREILMMMQAPERLANAYLNTIATTPRVIYATSPYGAFLQGTPIYTDWYEHRLNEALAAASTPQDVEAAVEAQKADFLIANPRSADPIRQKLARFAQGRFFPIATIGPLIVYRLHP